MSLHLRRCDTLRRRADFERARLEGKRFHGKFLSLNWLLGLAPSRYFAVIIPKRVGDSACRNRIKRRVREIYRTTQEALPTDLTSVWIVKSSAAQATHEQLKTDMERIYRSILA